MPTVKLYANLRKLAGTKEVSIQGETLGDVLGNLARTSPSLEGILLEQDRLRPHVIVTLNGHNINELNTQVTEQDVIAVFPPIAGGAESVDHEISRRSPKTGVRALRRPHPCFRGFFGRVFAFRETLRIGE